MNILQLLSFCGKCLVLCCLWIIRSIADQNRVTICCLVSASCYQNFKFPIHATASQSTSKWVLCFQQTNFKTEFQGSFSLEKFWFDYYKESLNHDWMGLPLGQSAAPLRSVCGPLLIKSSRFATDFIIFCHNKTSEKTNDRLIMFCSNQTYTLSTIGLIKVHCSLYLVSTHYKDGWSSLTIFFRRNVSDDIFEPSS